MRRQDAPLLSQSTDTTGTTGKSNKVLAREERQSLIDARQSLLLRLSAVPVLMTGTTDTTGKLKNSSFTCAHIEFLGIIGSVDHPALRIYVFIGINEDSLFNLKKKGPIQ